MYSKVEFEPTRKNLNSDFIIKTLRNQLPSTMLDNTIYHDILSDLILKNKSEKCPEMILDVLSDNQVKKALYEELYYSWSSLNQSEPYFSQSIAETLAWGFYLKSKEQKTLVYNADHSCNVDTFEMQKLFAFWEAVKFSGIRTIEHIGGFGLQSPQAFTMSCKYILECNLSSLTLSGSCCSPELWQLFWSTMKLSEIEHFGLHFMIYDSDEYWNIMCEGIKESKIKSLSLDAMALFLLSRTTWTELYQALEQVKIQSLELKCNDLYHTVPFKAYGGIITDNELGTFDLVCNLISLPSLKNLKFKENHLERMLCQSWRDLGNALVKSKLETLEIYTCTDTDHSSLTKDNWLIFIDSLKKMALKSLTIHDYGCRLSAKVWQPLCEMIEESQLQSIIFRSASASRQSANQWKMLGRVLKKKNIKLFDFGWIDGYEPLEMFGLIEGISISGIEALHMQKTNFAPFTPDMWLKFTTMLKDTNISLLDIRQSSLNSNYNYIFSCKNFCEMIVNSEIKTLCCDLPKSFPQDEFILFCDAIKKSKLETLDLNFHALPSENLKMLFEAINQSKILYLPNLAQKFLYKKELRDIIANTLTIIENRSKLKSSLFGLCTFTLFKHANAQLTESGISYKIAGSQREAALSETHRDNIKEIINCFSAVNIAKRGSD